MSNSHQYCSFEARKVIETIEEYGIELPTDEQYMVEMAVGRFWNTHIQKVIRDVMSGGNIEKKLEKIEMLGWRYFEKPIISMLTPRGGAHRTEQIDLPTDLWSIVVYDIVCRTLCLADFNMSELKLLAIDIPPMIPNGDIPSLIRSIDACKRGGSRTVYYLHGVIRREYQTLQGKIREIQQQAAIAEDTGWHIPANFEKMDPIERRELTNDWQNRLNDILIMKGLNDVPEA